MDKAERLKHSRISAGFKTASAAAEYMGVPYGTYSGHENGSRGIKEEELRQYSKIFKVSLYWLAFGANRPKVKLNLIGQAGSQPAKTSTGQKILEIDPPFPIASGTKALLVTTDDFEPMVSKNDLVLIGKLSDPIDLVGKRVATLTNGQILLGKLIEIKSNTESHIQLPSGKLHLNLRLDWVAEIMGVLVSQGLNNVSLLTDVNGEELA